MIDRTRFAAQGFDGGQPGAPGGFYTDDSGALAPKTVVWFTPASHAHLDPPGGGGYGSAFERDPARVLDDVVSGYVSLEAAARDYGVAVRYIGAAEQLVRLPEHYQIDWDATHALRGTSRQ